MQVCEAMTCDVHVANPDQKICDVARMMADFDFGAMPVSENDRLVGMITDRDIAIRAVAQGRSPDTPVREVMSQDVKYCFDDQEISEVAQNISEIQVHRLPVVDRNKRLVGILALADIASCEAPDVAGEAVRGISERTGRSGPSAMHH